MSETAMSHTLTLREAETRLRDLVKQAQITRQPVVLTAEETAKPVAVLVTSDDYEATQQQRQLLFSRQLDHLTNLLEGIASSDTLSTADRDATRGKQLTALRDGLSVLFDIGSERHQLLTAMLELAVRRLRPTDVSNAHVNALRRGLETLRSPFITETDIEACYTALLDSGIPPGFAYDDDMVQLYVAES